jgi:hypothetical protein
MLQRFFNLPLVQEQPCALLIEFCAITWEILRAVEDGHHSKQQWVAR